MKKPFVFVLIFFAIYSLGVVLYFNQDQIKSEIHSALSGLETQLPKNSENTNSSEVVEAKDVGVVKDLQGNEVTGDTPINVTKPNNDLSKVFNTPVDPARSRSHELQSLLQNSMVKNVITMSFMLFALIQWINYMANFSPSNALKEMITPAMATFLALNWDKVLSWFMIGL